MAVSDSTGWGSKWPSHMCLFLPQTKHMNVETPSVPTMSGECTSRNNPVKFRDAVIDDRMHRRDKQTPAFHSIAVDMCRTSELNCTQMTVERDSVSRCTLCSRAPGNLDDSMTANARDRNTWRVTSELRPKLHLDLGDRFWKWGPSYTLRRRSPHGL